MTNTQKNVNYAKFKVSDVLDEPIAGNVDIQKKDISNEGEIVVTSGLTDYGIKGRTTRKAKVVKEPSITIDMFGNVFYRDEPYKLVTHGRVYGFTSKLIKNREIGLYLVSALRPLGAKFSYNNMMTWSKLKDLSIELPVTPSGTPDFEYMEERIRELEEERIRELEEERIRELEAYLKVTGLSDATLTDEEQAALDKMNNCGITWKKFRVGDLFKINTGSLVSKRYLNANPGNVPRISVTTVDNGVIGYFDDTVDIPNIRYYKNFISVNFFGNVFYHPDKASVEMKVHVLQLKSGKALNRKIAMFLCGALSKVFDNGTYSYGNQLSSSKLKNNAFYIALPVTSVGDIDFDFMENYITAIEKQSIRGVIEYKDKVIQTTKNIVNAN